jgi:glycosyltransferase involved in cell wall biosynthesis
MKLLIVSSGSFFSKYGGGQEYLRNLIDELVRMGVNPYIASPISGNGEPEEYKGCHIFNFSPDISIEGTKLFLKKINPSIVHAHGYKNFFAIACYELGIPCIVTVHHGGIVCPAGALLNADDVICQVPASHENCLKCCVKTLPGWRLWYPLIRFLPVTFRLWIGDRLRHLPFILFLTPLGTISCNIRDKIQSVEDIGKNATRIIAPSNAIAEALARNGIPEKKIVIIPHGIPLLQHQSLRSDIGKGPVRFIFIGRINYNKGLHVMLEAFAKFPPEKYVLHIVGGADTRPEKRYETKLKRKFAFVNVLWHGMRPHEEITRYMAWCDVMIHPAICLEVFGLTIAEAISVGRPVIATSCGGAEMQIRDGENGFLVPPNDAAALAEKIEYFLKNPSDIIRFSDNIKFVKSIKENITEICIH